MVLPFISEIQLFLALLATAIGVLLWLGTAALIHRRRCRAVPIRIHVAGSRGKTTTVRLIGAALRNAGMRVLVKTTGTEPILIKPDGSETGWRRWTPPSISEQIRFFRHARQLNVDAVVLESMAIQPEYLWASEHYLVNATHTVITNVRADHMEDIGDSPMAAAYALSLVIPANGRLFVSEEAAVQPVLNRVEETGAKDRLATVPVGGLSHEEANRAIALAVCADLDVDQDVALAGFEKAGRDPGAFVIAQLRVNGRPLRFANAFSCNDPKSLEQLWRESGDTEDAVVLLNIRHDRPERTRAMLGVLAQLRPALKRLYITGFVPRRWIRKAGLADERIERLRTRDPRKALEIVSAAAGSDSTVWGVGNYSGLGRGIAGLIERSGAISC